METGAKEFVVKGFVETFDWSGMTPTMPGMKPSNVYLYNKNCEASYGTGRAAVSGEYLESIPFIGDDAFCVAPRS